MDENYTWSEPAVKVEKPEECQSSATLGPLFGAQNCMLFSLVHSLALRTGEISGVTGVAYPWAALLMISLVLKRDSLHLD